MNNYKIKISTNLLMKIREVTSSCLPISHSIIPYQILLVVMHHHTIQEELTVKKLFNSGAFSEMGNRYHYKKLVENQWILLLDHPTDFRLKLIQPSDQLIHAFGAMTESLDLIFPEIFSGDE